MDVFDRFKLSNGEVYNDPWIKNYYSVDASHHQIYPEGVCYPKDEYDIMEYLIYAKHNNLSVTCRGAGTGLLGQCLSNGLIFDFTKFMNKILDIDIQSNTVCVQPGIVKGVVDKELKKQGKFLPPDPASSNYCTLGGMVANNSSGIHSLGYGSIGNYLNSIDFIYSDCTEGYADDKFCDERLKNILKPLELIFDKIIPYYPDVSKNSCGYRIDSIFQSGFKPQNVFIASEGTLGIFKSLNFRIMDIPIFRSLFLIQFNDLLSASRYVKKILETKPVAMELLDSSIMDSSIIKSTLINTNECLVFVEYFFSFRNNVDYLHRLIESKICPDGKIVEDAHDTVSIDKIWYSRKNALNMAIKYTIGNRKPLSMIEDTAVSVDHLHDYLVNLLMIYREYKLPYVIYGHLGNGNLHTRPFIECNSKQISAEREKLLFEKLTAEVFKTVYRYRGTITGEHGDGISRSPYIKNLYGNFTYYYFEYLKQSFDSSNILNPGKKIL